MNRPNRAEYERFLKKDEPSLPPPEIPDRAKKSIYFAFILIFVGLLCLYLFVATFFENTRISDTEGRWVYLLFSLLTIPSGSYTLYVAYQVYHRNGDYNWPMIFFS